MREILFRAKRFPYHEWIQGYYLQKTAESGEVYHCMVATDGYLYDVDPNTVGEFTGFLDVNGNRIFEGDILKDEFCNYWLVSYELGAFCISNGHSADTLFDSYVHDIIPGVVCGNKWDNPELLNEDVRDGT